MIGGLHGLVLRTAYSLLGDGNGEEWESNPEYTRGIQELVADLLGLDKEDVLALIRKEGSDA